MAALYLSRHAEGVIADRDGEARRLESLSWDDVFRADDPIALIESAWSEGSAASPSDSLAPIVGQEIWAAGVTYERSRNARMLC